MSKKNIIHFVITGGTIDSRYVGEEDAIKTTQISIIPEFFERTVKLNGIQIRATQVCMKDSRELTLEDIEKMASLIELSSDNTFIVTHGTYTMPDTGRFLQKRLSGKDKTVILTGAMIPLGGFTPTDAGFNLGFAVANALILPPGVYIAMNGSILDPSRTMKVTKEGRFIEFSQT